MYESVGAVYPLSKPVAMPLVCCLYGGLGGGGWCTGRNFASIPGLWHKVSLGDILPLIRSASASTPPPPPHQHVSGSLGRGILSNVVYMSLWCVPGQLCQVNSARSTLPSRPSPVNSPKPTLCGLSTTWRLLPPPPPTHTTTTSHLTTSTPTTSHPHPLPPPPPHHLHPHHLPPAPPPPPTSSPPTPTSPPPTPTPSHPHHLTTSTPTTSHPHHHHLPPPPHHLPTHTTTTSSPQASTRSSPTGPQPGRPDTTSSPHLHPGLACNVGGATVVHIPPSDSWATPGSFLRDQSSSSHKLWSARGRVLAKHAHRLLPHL